MAYKSRPGCRMFVVVSTNYIVSIVFIEIERSLLLALVNMILICVQDVLSNVHNVYVCEYV